MNAQYQFLILMGLYMTVAFTVGFEVGQWAGRRRRERVKADE